MDARPVIVVGNGERPPEHLKDAAKDAELIGMDGGARWILRWGLVPDRVLGDLDSLDERTKSYADSYGTPILKTDDELTRSDIARITDVLIDEGRNDVTFTGCLGARFDHMLALLGAMGRLAAAGTRVRLVERWGTGSVASPRHPAVLSDLSGEAATLYPLSAEVKGLELSGFDTGNDPPGAIGPPFDALVGVPIVSDPAEVHVASGAVLVFVARREPPTPPEHGPTGGTPTFRLGTLERTE